MDDRRLHGFTLLELLVTLGVIGVLVSAGVPALQHSIQGARLRAAAQAVATDLRYARAEAVRLNHRLFLSFRLQSPRDWCYAVSDHPDCGCANACPSTAAAARTTTSSVDYPGVSLLRARFSRAATTAFSPLRGLARAGHISLQVDDGRTLTVVLSPLGRVRICSDNFTGYPPC